MSLRQQEDPSWAVFAAAHPSNEGKMHRCQIRLDGIDFVGSIIAHTEDGAIFAARVADLDRVSHGHAIVGSLDFDAKDCSSLQLHEHAWIEVRRNYILDEKGKKYPANLRDLITEISHEPAIPVIGRTGTPMLRLQFDGKLTPIP